jgi:hypothetical protein
MLLYWLLIGPLIGALAAQRRGYSIVGGILGGLLLGPLAFLMFFISGIFSSKEQGKKCSYCAEFVKREATVCKHCGKDLPPTTDVSAVAMDSSLSRGMSQIAKAVFVVVGSFVAICVVALVGLNGTANGLFRPTVTMAEFERLETGIDYEEAVRIIGAPGEEISRSELLGTSTVMYSWKNAGMSNMNAMFQNDRLITKAQFGLP